MSAIRFPPSLQDFFLSLIYLLLLNPPRWYRENYVQRIPGSGFCCCQASAPSSCGDDGINPAGMFFCGVTQSSFPAADCLWRACGVLRDAFLWPGRNATRSVTIKTANWLKSFSFFPTKKKRDTSSRHSGSDQRSARTTHTQRLTHTEAHTAESVWCTWLLQSCLDRRSMLGGKI